MLHCNKLVVLLFFVTLLSSCGSKSDMEFYSRQDVDLGYISTIAIVPFENNSTDKFAAERVRDMTITQTLAFGFFDVVDKGIMDSALREEAIDLSRATLSNTDLKRLGQLLGVEAFMIGTVDQAGNVQRGSVSSPQLSLTLRLVDIYSGKIIWQASGSESGQSYGKRLLGLATDDEFRVSLKLLRRLLRTIPMMSGELDPGENGADDTFKDNQILEPEQEEKVELLLEQG